MIEKKNCMGCMACVEACPIKCISVKKNDYGFEERIIDSTKCIQCGRCDQVCQLETPIKLFDIEKMYVVATKEKNHLTRSTSSGIATEISQRFIQSGGVVAGVGWSMEKGAHYYIAETEKELEDFRGSKYVYPDVTGLYASINEVIKTKRILLIGLPCIVAATKKYLNNDMDNLFCIDLICHGAPQASFLKEHLQSKGFNCLPDQISFRKGEQYIVSAECDKKHYHAEHYKDLYLYGFLNGLIQTEYCFQCKYSYDKRPGDLTLGDAWKQKIMNQERTSLVAVNSVKGNQLYNLIKEEMYCVEWSLEEFGKSGNQLKGPTKRHDRQGVFKKKLKRDGFEVAARKALKREMCVLQLRKKLSKAKKMIGGKICDY